MPIIHVLPDTLINKIAAGEVVERPASVVKELVENALDAAATRIEVDLEEGGKKYIRVHDNGIGISRDELRLAVSRHATSKISSAEDLENIASFGFRGEALASIASVSRFTLISRQGDQEASQIVVEGGSLIDESAAAHPQGSSVIVKHLFYNTPARLKFLKTNETEMTHILDYLTNAALVNPHVSFKVTADGKQCLFTDGRASLTDLVGNLFDKKLGTHCYEINATQGDFSISGLVSHPEINRSTSRDVHLFVNGRPVKDKMLIHAVSEAYRDLLMRGRYPFVVLFINLPGTMVDVNVHPAKTEVRFLNTTVIHRLVTQSLRAKLVQSPWIQKSDEPEVILKDQSLFEVKPRTEGELLKSTDRLFENDNALISALKKQNESVSDVHDNPKVPVESMMPNVSRAQGIGMRKIPYSELRIIGQFLATYLICEGGGQMVVVDQHAAHERIHFEKLLIKYQEGKIPSQNLLIPHNFDLKPTQTEILTRYLPDLQKFGYDIEFFGGNTFVVRSEPVLLSGRLNVKDMLLDLIGDVIEKGTMTSLKDKLHHVLATMACHGAIRANHRLEESEMRALLVELDEYHFTSFCPHGRPAAIEIQKVEMERWFKRIL